jgi:uncharacterized protein YndB with AHSA1/START domain
VRTSIEVIVEVEIERPLGAVWEFVSDADRMSEWLGEITATAAETDGPTGVGTVVRYAIGSRSGTFEVVEWDPPHRLAWDGPPLRWAGGGMRPRGSHTLTALGDDRTRLTSRYAPELMGTQVLLRLYLTRWARRQRTADAQTLKSMLEAAR